MFKLNACFFVALVLLVSFSPELTAQTGYYVEQQFVGQSFSPYGIQVTPDGSCYTYGNYFYYDGYSGPFVYGIGYSRSDQYGNMLWSNVFNAISDGSVYTAGIDVETNGDFHMLTTFDDGYGTTLRFQTKHSSGSITTDLVTSLDIHELRFVKALRLPDTDIAAVGNGMIYVIQSQWRRVTSYYRFSSAGELISTTDLYLQPGDAYPAQYALDMLRKDNGNLLIALKTFPQASVVEVTPEGQVVSSTPIPGYITDYTPMRLIREPGTNNYLAGLMSRNSDTESYQIRLFRIGGATAELLYTIDTEALSTLNAMESTDNRIFIVGTKASPDRLIFLCLDQQGVLDWSWSSLVFTFNGFDPKSSAIGPDGSLHWVGLNYQHQVLVKLPPDGSFVSVNDELVPGPLSLSTYPNPTSGSAKLSLDLPEAGLVKLKTYNLRGQLLKTESFPYHPGQTTEYDWEGKDSAGSRLPNGVYFLRVESGKQTRTARITLVQ